MERRLSWLEPAGFAVGFAAFVLATDPLRAALVATLLAGVIAGGRALVPKDPVAGAIAAIVLALAPPLVGAPVPSLVAACGAVWAIAFGLSNLKLPAIAAAVALVASTPWLVYTFAVPAAPIVVGAGLIGAAFGALTGLPRARWVAAAIVVCIIDPIAVIGACAIGIAVIPSAIVRVVGSDHRIRVAIAAGVPLVGAAVAACVN